MVGPPTPRFLVPVVLTCSVLGACGGGGGGGGSDPAPAPQPPPPPPFQLSASNVPSAGGISLRLVEEAYDMAGLGLGAAERLTAQSLANVVMDCGSNDSSGTAVSAYDDNDRDGRISSGDRVRLRQEDCDGVTTEILLDVTAATVAGSRVESIAGRLDYSRVPVSGNTEAGSVESEGAFELEYRTTAAGSSWSLTGIGVTSTADGMTDRLTGGVLRSAIANRDFSVEFNGRLQSDSLEGPLDFRTETAFSAPLGSFPIAGEMRLEVENSAASIAPSTDTMQADQAAWRVDTAGSGQFSDAVSVPWRDWIAGSLFNWYPLIRSLVIEPRRPVTTDSLIAVADIYNPQQRQLSVTFEWRYGIYIADSETLPYFLTDKGPVTLRLSVSDGVTSETLAVTTEILNSPPELEVRLSPETPDTTDDLVAAHQVSDIDLDDVSVSYQWYVNDEAVSGATGGMLRADRHRKADVVRLVVTADDGESTTTVPTTVTIGDAAPRVSATDVPDSVAYGNSVRFSAAVSDPDGDDVSEFRYRLEYGPEGMTVDPVTGRIEWLGKMPMFGPEMTVHWQVGGSSGPAIPSSGTIRLLDPARPYPHVRTSVRAPARARLFVEDFDGDGDDEVLVHDLLRNVYTLEWNGEHYVQTWMHPFPVGEFGIDEILFVTDGTGDMGMQAVWRLDENGELLNWFPVEEYDLGRQVRLLVLPGAVRKQVVVTYNSFFRTTSRLVAYDPIFGGKIWTSPELLGVVSPDSFHQFDVGGEPRLAIGTTSAMYVTQ